MLDPYFRDHEDEQWLLDRLADRLWGKMGKIPADPHELKSYKVEMDYDEVVDYRGCFNCEYCKGCKDSTIAMCNHPESRKNMIASLGPWKWPGRCEHFKWDGLFV